LECAKVKSDHDSPDTTFLFCAESGHFESQTLLAIECLRQFGGRFAKAPVLVITPRFGPSLTSRTLVRFAELGVTYIRENLGHRYSWFGFTNKALAAMLAEKYATTSQIIWMDSDTLVIKEPDLLFLEPDVDFAICAIDKNVGSGGPDDKNEAYWRALCDYCKVDIDSLPWITTEFDHERVRFRLHSGIYVFRRGLGFGRAWLTACEQMFDSGIMYSRGLPFPGDDVAMAFSTVQLGLRWRILPMLYNYEVTPTSLTYQRDKLPGARILHYHHSITNPEACAWMLQEITGVFPAVHDWLKGRVPLNPKVGGFPRSVIRRALREWRVRQQRQYEQKSQKYMVPDP
jgi:hypothetical protein